MKTVHQRIRVKTKKEASKLLAEINVNRARIGHDQMTMPELFDFLVEYYKENNND